MTDLLAAEPQSAGHPFLSLPALREEHAILLKAVRQGDPSPAVLRQVEEFIRRGQILGTVLDAYEDRWAAQSLLDYWATTLDRFGHSMPEATLADFNPNLAPVLDDSLCPYRGLEAFQREDGQRFFGRQRLVGELVEHLREQSLLGVIGPSGSGKSSLVLAGLVPALAAGALPGSGDWKVHPRFVPGESPLESLAAALCPPEAEHDAWIARQAAELRRDPARLATLLSELHHQTAVLVIDQFEEVFTLCTGTREREAFVSSLVGLLEQPEPRHRVVLTLRSDFESRMAQLGRFHERFAEHVVRVTPLSAGELRESIEKPAAAIGLKFEQGVVDRLLHDVVGEPAALPLLQFTLLKLWESRERNRITMAAYNRLGGGRQALATSADELWEKLMHEEQVTARRILLRMVRPDSGLEVTSNRIRRERLYRMGEANDRIDRVLDKLVHAGLARRTPGRTPVDDRIEVAHEALIRNWPRLIQWLEEERETLRQRLQFSAAVQKWDRNGRDPALLWRGQHLVEASAYEDLSDVEQAFLHRGRRREQRGRLLAWVGLGVAAVLVVGIGLLMYWSTTQRRQNQIGIAASLAAGSLRELDQDPERSILLALEAVRMSRALGIPTLQAEEALHRAVQASRVMVRVTPDPDRAGPVNTVAVSAGGRRFATGDAFGVVKIWSTATGREELALTGHDQGVVRVVFYGDPGSERLVSGSWDGSVRVWDAQSGAQLWVWDEISGGLSDVAVSPDGRYIAVGSNDGSVMVREGSTGEPRVLSGHANHVASVTFSPDGQYLATAGWDNTARIFEVGSGELLHDLRHQNLVHQVAFHPLDPGVVATSDEDGMVNLWSISGPSPVRQQRLAAHSSPVIGLAFSPDGRQIATTASFDRRILLWNVATGAQVTTLSGHRGTVAGLAFGETGRTLATAGADGSARIWNLGSTGIELPHSDEVASVAYRPGHGQIATASGLTVRFWESRSGTSLPGAIHAGAPVVELKFSPDGARLAVSLMDDDDAVEIWEMPDALPRRVHILSSHFNTVSSLAFDVDGRRLVTGSYDYTAKLWDAHTGQELRTLGRNGASPDDQSDHGDIVTDVAFHPDGQLIATAGRYGGLRVWNAESGSLHWSNDDYVRADEGIWRVAFSPDGQYLATVGGNGNVRLWESNSFLYGRELGYAPSDQMGPTLLRFSPDSEQLVIGGHDASLELLDVGSLTMLSKLTGLPGPVRDLTFTSGTSTELIIARGNTVWLDRGNQALDSLVALALSKITRPLSTDECRTWARDESCGAAIALVLQGRDQLHAGLTDEAAATFRRAFTGDGGFGSPAGTGASYLHHYARALLAADDGAAAATSIETANRLRTGGAVDVDREMERIRTELRARRTQELAVEATRLLDAGQVAQASLMYEQIWRAEPSVLSADDWNRLCWFGSLRGHASRILEACERAVSMAPQDTGIHDSRGLARALNGERGGAIEDFQAFADDPAWSEQERRQRQAWITEIRANRNPFTTRLLRELLEEG
jgi:WD40 repeat protein